MIHSLNRLGSVGVIDFEARYKERYQEIRKLSYTQYVPGMDPDDVASELTIALWKAHLTYNATSGCTFGQWWWAVWKNRKRDLFDAYHARVEQVPMARGTVIQMIDANPTQSVEAPDCPLEAPLVVRIWELLADGYTGVEIREMINVSIRQFYNVITTLQTAEVRQVLA